MGDFRITVNAVGGHGCQREQKDGSVVYGCGSMRCPDCLTAKYIADLARSGASVKDATLQHWPGQPSAVTDTFEVGSLTHSVLAPRKRSGSF